MYKNKEDFIENVNQNHEYFLRSIDDFKKRPEINSIFHYNSIFTLLCKKIIESEYFENFWNELHQRSFKNKQEYILLFSFGIGLIDANLYNKISKLHYVRSENTITHPINIFINFDFSKFQKEIENILNIIKDKKHQYKNKKINIDIERSIIIFLGKINDESVNFENAVIQKNENDIKKIISEINKKNDYVIDYLSKLLVENINEFKFNKNILDIFKLMTNVDSRKKLIINIIQAFRPIESYRYLDFIYKNYDRNLIVDNISLIIDLLFKWKNSQWKNYYQFDEIRDILKSELFDHILEVWIKDGIEENNLIDFYEWVIFDGNFAGITYYASTLEDKLLEKKGFELMLKEFYTNNIENIVKRINRGNLSNKMDNFLKEIEKEITNGN